MAGTLLGVRKKTYQQMFWIEKGAKWYIKMNWCDGYSAAAEVLLDGLISEKFLDSGEGVVAVFLSRHYLEPALKCVLFHARWLKTRHRNAPISEIKGVEPKHYLWKLWATAKRACVGIIPAKVWRSWNIEFVDHFVKEFESVDPYPGVTFRYPTPGFSIGSVVSLAIARMLTPSIMRLITWGAVVRPIRCTMRGFD